MYFEINGNKFKSKKGFYNYIEALFTAGLSWEIGRNLDAFVDVLEGGFGKHGHGEAIEVVWINFKKSEERLDRRFLDKVIEIIEEQKNVTFSKYDFVE